MLGSKSNLIMTMCLCGGNSKLIIDSYVINTRIPGNRRIVLKNVRYWQCRICGQMELTPDSQRWVNHLRDFYINQYYEESKKTALNEESADNPSVKGFLKKFGL